MTYSSSFPAVSILVPSCLVALTFLHDIASTVHSPETLSKAYVWLTAPFRNFLYLEDLDEATPEVLKRKAVTPAWKINTLTGLSCVQALLSLLRAFLTPPHDGGKDGLWDLALTLAWVGQPIVSCSSHSLMLLQAYAGLHILLKRPSTPPYLIFAFYIACLVLPAGNLFLAVVHGARRPIALSLSVSGVQILVSFVCAYIIGTLPVKSIPPGPDVAGGKEVSYN